MKTSLEYLKGAGIGALIAMALLAMFEPFGIDRIENHRLLFIATEGILAVLVSLFSIWIVRATQIVSIQGANRRQIGGHLLVVHAINIPLLSAALLSFNGWMNHRDLMAYWILDGAFSLRPYWIMMQSVAIVSVFVFFIQLILSFNNKLKSQLDEVRSINNMLEARLERLSELQKEESLSAESADATIPTITLKGSSGNRLFEVSPADIIYIESMSNYADICYMRDEGICHQQLRTTMRQLREELAEIDYLVSCHRAYIVNLNFVSNLSVRSGSDYYQLHLFGNEKLIPVSRSNTEEIKRRLK